MGSCTITLEDLLVAEFGTCGYGSDRCLCTSFTPNSIPYVFFNPHSITYTYVTLELQMQRHWVHTKRVDRPLKLWSTWANDYRPMRTTRVVLSPGASQTVPSWIGAYENYRSNSTNTKIFVATENTEFSRQWFFWFHSNPVGRSSKLEDSEHVTQSVDTNDSNKFLQLGKPGSFGTH